MCYFPCPLKLEQVNKAIRARKLNPEDAFRKFDTTGDGFLSYDELQRAFAGMRLGFSPQDISEVIRLADVTSSG
jgi:Ca2+-binding EF-hand superfamily protein